MLVGCVVNVTHQLKCCVQHERHYTIETDAILTSSSTTRPLPDNTITLLLQLERNVGLRSCNCQYMEAHLVIVIL